MARKSLSAQLAEAREHMARQDIRIAELEAMLRENAERKAKSFKARVQSRSEAAREYCKHHGVTSVSKQQLDAWMMQ